MEKEISRRVKIIQSSADESERRVVVELQFAIGDHQQVAEFTLADRTNLPTKSHWAQRIARRHVDRCRQTFATELPESYLEQAANGEKNDGTLPGRVCLPVDCGRIAIATRRCRNWVFRG